MNRSKGFYITFVSATILLVSLLFLKILPYAPSPSGEGMGWMSINRYLPSIETNQVSNWYSSLFMYECIGLKKLGSYVFDREFSGMSILYGVWIGMTIMMFGSIIVLVYSAGMRGYWWLFALPLCVFLSFSRVEDLFPINLDYNFVCLIWCLIAAMFTFSSSATRKWRLGNVVLLLLLLMHLIAYRRNFAVAVPFIMGWLFYMSDWFIQRRMWHKFAIWGMGTVALIFFSLTWVETVFLVQKEHPLSPMMESDMRIAAILRGDVNPTVREGYQELKGELAESSISAYWYKIQEDNWEMFRNLYVKEWKDHPETMCAAGIIQRIQFFSGGHSCQFLKRAVETIYPAVRENDKAWEIVAPTVSSFRERLFGLLMAPIGIVMGVIFMKRNLVVPEICSLVIITGSISTLYATSYLIVVPTSDARYLAPAYMLSIFSIFTVVCAILELAGRRMLAKLGLQKKM